MNSEAGSPKSEACLTLVCFALKEEAAAFKKAVASGALTSILLTGIGRKNAEAAVRNYVQHHSAQRVFTCGFAGGLDPELETGDVVFSTTDASLARSLSAAGATPARFHCAARVATTAAEKTQLRRATGADAVEMESEAIQVICRERGIPCATVRVISDPAWEDLPLDFNALAKSDSSIHYGKLTLAIARSPGKISALLRLQKHTRLAAEELARVLGRVIEQKALPVK